MTPEMAERLRVLHATNAATTGAAAASILRSAWRPAEPEVSFDTFVARAVPVIASGARQANLIGRSGWVAGGGEAAEWQPFTPEVEAIRGSLYGAVRPALTQPEESSNVMTVRKAQSATIGVAVRRVTSTHQQSTIDSVQRSRVRTAYMLVTRANPCYFCAMLASRGPVYLGDSMAESDVRFQGPGSAKVHDNCGCALIRIGPRDLDANAWKWLEYDQLWTKVIYGTQENRDAGKPIVSSPMQLYTWRKAWDALHPPSRTARWETLPA